MIFDRLIEVLVSLSPSPSLSVSPSLSLSRTLFTKLLKLWTKEIHGNRSCKVRGDKAIKKNCAIHAQCTVHAAQTVFFLSFTKVKSLVFQCIPYSRHVFQMSCSSHTSFFFCPTIAVFLIGEIPNHILFDAISVSSYTICM